MTKTVRKLATILAADCVEFSRLMDENEELTLDNLKKCRDIIDPIIEEYNGRIFHTAGDSVIAEFNSPVDSVNAGIEFQNILADRNNNVPENSRLMFRVGIHLDDVIIEGDNIYGSGVNIAARLEGICQPGCIYLSRTVQDQIAKRVQLTVENMGNTELKNIHGVFEVYKISPGLKTETDSTTLQKQSQSPELIQAKPRLIVIPFRNLNNNEENDYFVDGVVEDIITEFSMISSIEIISRATAFEYKGSNVDLSDLAQKLGVNFIVSGSIRSAGERVRVSAELTDPETGSAIWSERYDRKLEDVFEVQDEIVRKIVNSLIGELESTSLERAKRKPTTNMTSYDYLLRGRDLHHRFNKDDCISALEMLDQSIKADQDNAQAHAWKACTLGQGYSRGYWNEDKDATIEKIRNSIETARSLDENNFECHRMLCAVYTTLEDFDTALQHGERSYQMNPNDPRVVSTYGEILALTENPKLGIELLEKAYQLDPQGVGLSDADKRLGDIMLGYFSNGDYEICLSQGEKINAINPQAQLIKICCLGALERYEERDVEIEKYKRGNLSVNIEEEVDKFHFKDKTKIQNMKAFAGLMEN